MNKSSFFIAGQHAVIEALRNPNRKVLRVFLTEDAKKNMHRKNPRKNVLLFGSEGYGMREHTGKYADFFVKININNNVESLNISNSAAIVFHHLDFLKRNIS